MTIFTSRRSINRQKNSSTRQLIVFCLQQEWFALPIQAVYRVMPLEHIYGAPHGNGMGLTRYENQEIPVLDIKHQIFGETLKQSLSSNSSEVAQQRYLLIIRDLQGELVGIPLDSQPSLRRFPESAFTSPPASYVAQGKVRCVSALVVSGNDQPSLFLLDIKQLIQPSLPLLPHARNGIAQ
jgi:purine-binding chemotaxis protein CheW